MLIFQKPANASVIVPANATNNATNSTSVYYGTVFSSTIIEGVLLNFSSTILSHFSPLFSPLIIHAVEFDTEEGLEHITADLHYAAAFVSVDADLEYDSSCTGKPKINGTGELALSGILDKSALFFPAIPPLSHK